MKAFSQRHPLIVYFTLAYAIAWGGILLINFWNGFHVFYGQSVLSNGIGKQIMFIWFAMLAGPGIAGLFLKYIVDGKEGLKQMLSLLVRWKVSIQWYAAALLIMPALVVLVIYSFVFISKNYSPGLMLGTGIGAGLIGGFFEEIGWTGFALPKLQLRYTPFVAAIILGLIHAVWHLPADYLGGISFYKELYWLHFLLWIIALTAFRVLAVWIYNHSNSLLLAQITHASFTGSQLIFGPPAVTATEAVLWYAVFTVILCIVASIIILKDKKLFFQQLK
ncbi:MAG: CPBP family intramembrane glutamic endopeptidase [Sphingobacteriales bacterium]